MKRSKMLMIGAAVAAVSLFTVTALASTPNTAGYDAFKEILKANHMAEDTFESATVKGSFTLAADGEKLITGNGTTKVVDTGETHAMSSDFEFNLLGVERSGSVYSTNDEDTVYLVDRTHDLHYQVINVDDEHENYEHEWEDEDDFHKQPMNKAQEALLDYMVGDLKNEFSVSNHADGSKTITVDVSRDEIPLPLRLLMDVAANEEPIERPDTTEGIEEWELLKQYPFFQGLEDLNLEERLPEMTEDVAIERVRLALTVDRNNDLQSVEGELEVNGKDDAGVSHTVEIEGAGAISDFNTTTPDVYDPGHKSIEIIDAAAFDDDRN